jgi:hypothetical protein
MTSSPRGIFSNIKISCAACSLSVAACSILLVISFMLSAASYVEKGRQIIAAMET